MKQTHWLILAMVIFTWAGCKQKLEKIPAITENPTGTWQTGKFVWHELASNQPEASKEFYEQMFNWKFEAYSDEYELITHDGKPIGGIVALGADASAGSSQWVSFLSVTNVDRGMEIAKANGGSVVQSTVELPGRGKMAVVRDPRSAPVGIIRTNGGDPAPTDAIVYNEWIWNELWTDDAPNVQEYYMRLAGLTSHNLASRDSSRDDYWILFKKKEMEAGIIPIPEKMGNVKPNWLPYVAVEDLEAAVERVQKLGGEVLIAPEASSNRAAIVTDPSGAPFGIHKWPYSLEPKSPKE
ncbi:VOC family protein [Pontibacter sp. G13]|uniref:VOC family protein n=1 Tax=Pontibacter sp. G13 TaxID=3074898 RepID=UPI002889E532|nr:VOC family protein [Pontibacter sp. G13]WNJ18860.1 VOC family protein [Pontibacter sp. G13]